MLKCAILKEIFYQDSVSGMKEIVCEKSMKKLANGGCRCESKNSKEAL